MAQYALVIGGVIESVGGLPKAARRLDTSEWVTPPGGVWPDPSAHEACGYFEVTTTPRPPDTDTGTHTKTIELDAGIPVEVWTPRLWTDDELAAQRTASLRIEFDVAQANLTPTETDALLGSTAPPEGEPWVQPAGAHDAYPADWQVTHNGVLWESLMTANVWEPGVTGWRETGNDWPDWVQPAGAHDTYTTGDQVTHNTARWISDVDNNSWEPGVYGWEPA